MSDPILTLDEYRTALARVTSEARAARDELATAHAVTADAEAAYRRGQAKAWADADGRNAPERDAQVQSMTADLRKARDIGRGRVEVAKAAIRDCSDRRVSLDTIARWSQRLGEMDRVGPNLAALSTERAAA